MVLSNGEIQKYGRRFGLCNICAYLCGRGTVNENQSHELSLRSIQGVVLGRVWTHSKARLVTMKGRSDEPVSLLVASAETNPEVRLDRAHYIMHKLLK